MTRTIEYYLRNLIYEYDCVIIPGFGGFICHNVPAVIHPENHRFSPPARKISFNSLLLNDDGLLLNTISRAENLSYGEAKKQVEKYELEIREELSRNKIYKLDKIGTFHPGVDETLYFQPDLTVNYYSGAYGLNSFIAFPIRKEEARRRSYSQPVDRRPERIAQRLPKSVKRTIIAAIPVMLFLLWGIIIPDSFRQAYTNYSGIITDIFSKEASSPEKTFNLNEDKVTDMTPYKAIVSIPESGKSTAIGEHRVQPEMEKDSFIASDGEALQDKDISAEKTFIQSEPIILPPSGKYFVIGGAFLEKENAQRFIEDLQSQGYYPEIAGQNRSGQYRVSYRQFGLRSEAVVFLEKIKSEANPSAWLLKY